MSNSLPALKVALRKESVDRNPPMCTIKPMPLTSLSARRAWIEMDGVVSGSADYVVALRKESVDRNYKERPGQKARPVALRKESVDRNPLSSLPLQHLLPSLSARRAWIEIDIPANLDADRASLSARRAWIEILICFGCLAGPSGSLSARRAWIEIGAKADSVSKWTGRSPQGERG